MTEQEIAVKDALLDLWNKNEEKFEVVMADAAHDVIIYKKTNSEGKPVYQGCIRNFDRVRNGHQQIMRMWIDDEDLEKLKESLAKDYAHDHKKYNDRGGMVH